MNWMRCILLLLSVATASFAEDTAIERWDRAVCLQTERKTTDGQPTMASAFIVERDGQFYILTAAHAAQDTHARTKVVYRAAGGEPRWVHLGGVVESSTDPWNVFGNADLAVARLHRIPETAVYHAELQRLAIPFRALEPSVPKRTTAVEITGFPMALGTQPPVAPLAMVAHVASRELSSAARWGAERVFYAVPTVAAGCSGGPVFKSQDNPSDATIVGMYIGLISDTTGAKLSKIIPASVIRSAIERNALPLDKTE